MLFGVEVKLLDSADLIVQSFVFVLVGVHLGLVVLQVFHHFLEFGSSLLEVLLVNLESLGNLRSRLLRKDVLQLDV